MKQFRASLGFNVAQLNSPLSTQLKLTKTLGGVVFIYVLTYIPASVMSPFMFEKPSESIYILWHFVMFLWCTNFWVNPFVYAAKNKDFKRAFKKLLRIGRKSNQVHDLRLESSFTE